MTQPDGEEGEAGPDAAGPLERPRSGGGGFETVGELRRALEESFYFASEALATAVFLALELQRPLLLEGEAGVGKTEVAKVLSRLLGRPLLRLQCYEGLDVHSAVYEWDYSRQLLAVRMLEAAGEGKSSREAPTRETLRREIYSPDYLLKRPLLRAIDPEGGRAPVLLIDELDRADEEFEAFLLEILSDFQITIPELGTLRAAEPPVVVVTSNRTREIHDALRRRCLYHWLDYPSADKELAIVRAKVPGLAEALSKQVVAFVQNLRKEDLYKRPGVAETLDWAAGLQALDRTALTPEAVEATLGLLLKYQDDVELLTREKVEGLLAD